MLREVHESLSKLCAADNSEKSQNQLPAHLWRNIWNQESLVSIFLMAGGGNGYNL